MEYSSSNKIINIRNIDCAATSASSITTNTSPHRRRRGGAAKGRLAKAKEAAVSSHNKHGWHESMEAASIAAGREWKPEKGWQNYKGPIEKDSEGESDSLTSANNIKIRIPLHVAATVKDKRPLHTSQDDDEWDDPSVSFSQATTVTTGPSPHRETEDVSVMSASPVPPQIHRICRSQPPPTNNAMTTTAPFDEPPQQSQQQQQYPNHSNYTIPTDHSNPRQHIFRPSSSPTSTSVKSNRWVESMERATAQLAKHGHYWDPKHGFTTLRGNASDVNSMRSVPVPMPVAVDDTVSFNDTTTRRHIPILYKGSPSTQRSLADPPGKSAMELEVKALMKEEEEDESDEGMEVDASSFLRKINNARILESQDGTASALNFEEEEDYIIPSPTDIPFSIVKKEKIRSEDYGLFRNSPQPSLDGRLPLATRAANGISPTPESSPGRVKEMSNATTNNRNRTPRSSGTDNRENDVARPRNRRSPEPEPEQHKQHGPTRHDNTADNARVGHERHKPERQQRHSQSEEVTQASNGDQKDRSDEKYLQRTRRSSVEDDANARNPCEVTSSPWACLSPQDIDSNGLKTRELVDLWEVYSNSNSNSETTTPADMRSIDASQISTQSSATAGWKTFLAKKVRAENEAAVHRQRNEHVRTEEKPNKDEAVIKKTVSFASDTLRTKELNESLVDSLFDFGEGGSLDGVARNKAVANREDVFRSPRSWNGSRARLSAAAPQYRDRTLPTDEVEEPQPIAALQSGSGQAGFTHRLSPHPIDSKSFEELMDGEEQDGKPSTATATTNTIDTSFASSATTTEKECLETDDQAYYNESPTFLQRLAECKSGPSCSSQKRNNNSNDRSIFASRIVEEMINSLRSQRPNSGCTSLRGSSNSDSPTTKMFGGMESHPNVTAADPKGSESDAEAMARARVDALVENLYYSSPSSPSRKASF